MDGELEMVQPETALNSLRARHPRWQGGGLAPEVRGVAALYGRMIWQRQRRIVWDALPPAQQLLLAQAVADSAVEVVDG